MFWCIKEKEKQALILGSRTVNGGPQASLWNILQIDLLYVKNYIEKKLKVKGCFSHKISINQKRDLYHIHAYSNTMDPALKYSARVVKTSWFMLRKWKMLFFNLWGFLVKMCCYRKKYIYIISLQKTHD